MAASKKLYVEMAKTIRNHVDASVSPWNTATDSIPLFVIKSLVSDLCSDLKQDNINFNRDKFMTACGFES